MSAMNFIIDRETGQLEATPNLDDAKREEAEARQAVEDATAAEEANLDAQNTPDLPAKYRGKSLEEIVEMHQNAERALGRARDEVGQWRRLATTREELEQGNHSEASDEEEEELTSDALLNDPNKAITSAVQRAVRKELEPVHQRFQQEDTLAVVEEFNSRHSDADEVVGSEEFRSWATRSPYRKRRASAAAMGDYEAALELLDDFKADTSTSAQPSQEGAEPAQEEAPARADNAQPRRDSLAAARAAATESGGTSAPISSKKRYSTVELQRMINNDFQRYSSAEFQAELQQAIKEGRVDGL